MHELLDSFIKCSKPCKSDYAKKYEELLNGCKADDNVKQEETVSEAGSSSVDEKVAETTAEKICPKCGKPLILRTAKKGDKAGNQFYGCSGFPKCRYIENV